MPRPRVCTVHTVQRTTSHGAMEPLARQIETPRLIDVAPTFSGGRRTRRLWDTRATPPGDAWRANGVHEHGNVVDFPFSAM
ncbi:unnamed protein product, partial [Iphiclides podalirius]